MAACSQGTWNLLRLARLSEAQFLYVSSAEAYGNPAISPQTESYTGNVDPIGPRSAYEEGKRFGEALVVLHCNKYGIDGRIVRVFNTYGRFMSVKDQRVIPQFLSKGLKREPIIVYGDGSQMRTFLYVDDLVQALLKIMALGGSGAVYNVGGDSEISIAELLVVVAKQFEHELDVQFRPHFIEDHGRRKPCTAKIRALGWSPKVPLEQGLTLSLTEMAEAIVPVSARGKPSRPDRANGSARTMDKTASH